MFLSRQELKLAPTPRAWLWGWRWAGWERPLTKSNIVFDDWWDVETWESSSETGYLCMLTFLSRINESWEDDYIGHWDCHTQWKPFSWQDSSWNKPFKSPLYNGQRFQESFGWKIICKSLLDNSWTETKNHGVSPLGTVHCLNEYQIMGLEFTGQKALSTHWPRIYTKSKGKLVCK